MDLGGHKQTTGRCPALGGARGAAALLPEVSTGLGPCDSVARRAGRPQTRRWASPHQREARCGIGFCSISEPLLGQDWGEGGRSPRRPRDRRRLGGRAVLPAPQAASSPCPSRRCFPAGAKPRLTGSGARHLSGATEERPRGVCVQSPVVPGSQGARPDHGDGRPPPPIPPLPGAPCETACTVWV